MNTLLDLFKFNRERASRHVMKSDRGWWSAGLAAATVFVVSLVCARIASATPSPTYWAPSVATCQAKYVPHITYDTDYGKGTPPPGLGAPTYPIDTGLTMGILPWDEVQSEATARSSRPARSSARPRQTSTWD